MTEVDLKKERILTELRGVRDEMATIRVEMGGMRDEMASLRDEIRDPPRCCGAARRHRNERIPKAARGRRGHRLSVPTVGFAGRATAAKAGFPISPGRSSAERLLFDFLVENAIG
jgi:hypothetical protein